MFQTIGKKIIKILTVILGGLIISFLFLYIYVYRSNIIAKKIKDNGRVSFSILLYGTDKMFPDKLDLYIVLYDKKNNILKILYVNTDIVVFKKKEKARSLKTRFNENTKKDLDFAIQKFYLDLYGILGDVYKSDFYINISYEMLDIMTCQNEEFRSFVSKDNFANKDLTSLNRYETIECILNLMPHKILKIYKNFHFFDTNIVRISFIASVLKFRILKPALMFCELPVKYTNTRVEADKQNIEIFLSKIYYAHKDLCANTKDLFIDIKNASEKPRMAAKVAWLLRKNEFDVLDWGTSPIAYNKTLIKDCKGNFKIALKIAELLKTGKVIVFYDNRIYSDINVFIGKDCMIYDNFDKQEELNGKN
jgi:hypothetical protein